MCACVCVRACVRACVHACMRVRARAPVSMCEHTRLCVTIVAMHIQGLRTVFSNFGESIIL